MTRYVAFLRGINVGGKAVIKMTELKAAFVSAGCGNVRTYIQSGNVIFDAPEKSTPSMFRKIHGEVRTLLTKGDPVIIYRTAQELQGALKRDPFKGLESDPGVKLYVTMLLEKSLARPQFPWAFPKDAFEAIGMKNLDLFLVSRPLKNGMYGFPNLPIEKELGVVATTRNWNTIKKIVELSKDT